MYSYIYLTNIERNQHATFRPSLIIFRPKKHDQVNGPNPNHATWKHKKGESIALCLQQNFNTLSPVFIYKLY